jgi:hypothetical protein
MKGALGRPQGESGGESLEICVRYLLMLCLALILGGCASQPAHPSRKWYQGTMDNQDRSFFIDSFLDNH